MIGESLGPYKILEPLGAGGMGEVYLGEDSRLGRNVAIKVLPAEFASDPERLARFEQEARAAAALNHPHIAVVHDIGSEPSDDGGETHFMVQEHLEGESLGQRLDKGAVPLDKAIVLATEVCEALIAAHKAGIVHRDLKPDNIFVTEEGHAKVLDFGLAKLMEMSAVSGSASMSPTMLGTVAGQVMGTAGYMAPEQINGEEVDHRADLFAFGCVLYGMVTGRRAFSGKNVHETLGRILSDDPEPVARIDTSLPPELQRIVRKALAKDVSRRYQTAADLGADLRQLQDDIAAGVALSTESPAAPAPHEAPVAPAGVPWKSALPAAAAIALVAILGTWLAARPGPAAPGFPVRFQFDLPEGTDFTNTGRRSVAISPDGSRVVFAADGQLWMRLLGALDAAPIPGTEEGRTPFFSPDGEQIGFYSGGQSDQFMRVSVTGGAPVAIGAAENPWGASWAGNGMIYFGQGRDGIWQVPGTGGTPEVVIEMQEGESAHGPQLLPGGEWLLFTLRVGVGSWSEANIVVQSLLTDERIVLIEGGTEARWVPTGHIVYALDGTLLAVAFDPAAVQPPSGPASMEQGIRMATGNITGAANYGFADNGTLIYIPGRGGDGGGFRLAWVGRDGSVEPLPFEARDSFALDLSPDGSHVAVEILSDDGERDIWIYEAEREGSQVRLTREGDNRTPVWSHDGEWVFFASDRAGDDDIWKRRVDLSTDAELVLDLDAPVRPSSISADGEMLLFHTGTNPRDIGILALDGEREPEMLVVTPADELAGDFSPDGRFFAFHSNETDQVEVYAMEVASRRKFPVSTSNVGGAVPQWSRDGREIFFTSTNSTALFVADVDVEDFSAATPVRITDIFRRRFTNFDVTADGQRLLVTTFGLDTEASAQATLPPRINVILDWFEELKERVPTGR